MKPAHCSWVDMQKIRAALSNGKRGDQAAYQKQRACVSTPTVSEWKAVCDVMNSCEDKVRISELSHFQPSHALSLAKAFRKRYGRDAAAWDADELVEWIEHCEEKELTVEQFDADLKAEGRKRAAKEAQKNLPSDDALGVRHGDFRDVVKGLPSDSVSLIFTDPPYDRDTLPLYGDLAESAKIVLRPGGSLICYLGQYQIHEVCALMTPHLRLWWTLCCLHTGQSARMTEYGIVVKWKPMLWFVKGTRGDKLTFVDDLVESEQEKDTHEWQQGLREAGYYIDKLTHPGDLVFDPFCGGGTTAVAAKLAKRRWLTCDVNAESAILARRRVHEA